MAWSRAKTQGILVLVLILALIFAIISIVLLILNLTAGHGSYYGNSFIYLLGSTYITGIGCIWFRLVKAKKTFIHGILHLIALILMIAGHREIINLTKDKDHSECFHQYSLSMFTIIVYVVQFILSLHLVLFRGGRNQSERAFRAGLHAFIGALTFFACVMDGLLATQSMGIRAKRQKEVTAQLSCVFLLVFAVFAWYLLLNPYFDWRRLNAMAKTAKIQKAKMGMKKSASKTKVPPRTSSKSSIKSGSRPATKRF